MRFLLFSTIWIFKIIHIDWYKTNLFTREISKNFSNQRFDTKAEYFNQLFWTNWTLQIIHVDTKLTFSLGIFQLFLSLQIIDLDTNTNFSVGRFQQFSYKSRHFELLKSYIMIQKLTFSVGKFQIFHSKNDTSLQIIDFETELTFQWGDFNYFQELFTSY